jgi:hypothetical protein
VFRQQSKKRADEGVPAPIFLLLQQTFVVVVVAAEFTGFYDLQSPS